MEESQGRSLGRYLGNRKGSTAGFQYHLRLDREGLEMESVMHLHLVRVCVCVRAARST